MSSFDDFRNKFSTDPKKHDAVKNPSKGFAIASMVLGICSIVFVCIPFISIPCGVVGLVLGYKSIMQMRDGWAMAKAGFITSIVGLGIIALYITVYIIASMGNVLNVFPF